MVIKTNTNEDLPTEALIMKFFLLRRALGDKKYENKHYWMIKPRAQVSEYFTLNHPFYKSAVSTAPEDVCT